ncbi:hypothetical protein GCM10017600_68420 [Streptosporangium carneum]|uniref:Uncharacterized protein n=1 Tax=Streptosporangium carneum TaxID=47481 RepID=A0A9W6I8N6_9ACTN|nr:hypothetical protein GCM10017600_68420 [Streptosporangium carneum]
MDRPTMTQPQALERVEQLIKETVDMMTPKPRLELYRPSVNVGSCLDPTDGGSENRVVINRSYYLHDIPKEKLGEVAGQVRRYWEQKGYHIEGVSQDGLGVAGRSRPDDFLLSLSAIGEGDFLGLGATSPCVWPNGTPEPSSSS